MPDVTGSDRVAREKTVLAVTELVRVTNAAIPPAAEDVDDDRRTLASLLDACGQGDRIAFRTLYDLTARHLFGITLAVLRNREMAEEVAQEVYVSIWKRAQSYDAGMGNPMSWMAAIARNRAIDRLRAERTRGFVTATAELPELAAEGSSDAMAVEGAAVRRVLDDLRPEYRKALILAYYNGYTYAELAEVMDIPVGTAKSWIRRGLGAMREALE